MVRRLEFPAKTTGEVRLGEDNIGVSGTRRADFAGLRAIWSLTAGFGLVNAHPRRQS